MILCLNWAGLSAIGNTFAYFNDQEDTNGNLFSVATLDFSITNQNVGGFIGIGLGEDKEFTSVVTKTSGGLALQYKVRAEKISGNDDFCNALKLEVFHSVISYDGALLSFDTAATTALGAWAFEVRLPQTSSNFAHGEECNVDLVFEAWRDDVADFNQSGFNDEERIQLRFTSRMIVLNEFLPNPDGVEYNFDFGQDGDSMPQGEWVELYNNSDYDFDLAGWYIKDSLETDVNKIMITDSNTVPVGTIIGSKKWLVVYMNKAVLDNDGDTVKLFDDADALVDSHAYTSNDYCDIELTPGGKNSTDTLGSCAGVPPNKSYARIPDGIGGWVDPVPTPGGINILESEDTSASSVAIVLEPGEEDELSGVSNNDVILQEGAFLASAPGFFQEDATSTDNALSATSDDVENENSEDATSTDNALSAISDDVENENSIEEDAPAIIEVEDVDDISVGSSSEPLLENEAAVEEPEEDPVVQQEVIEQGQDSELGSEQEPPVAVEPEIIDLPSDGVNGQEAPPNLDGESENQSQDEEISNNNSE